MKPRQAQRAGAHRNQQRDDGEDKQQRQPGVCQRCGQCKSIRIDQPAAQIQQQIGQRQQRAEERHQDQQVQQQIAQIGGNRRQRIARKNPQPGRQVIAVATQKAQRRMLRRAVRSRRARRAPRPCFAGQRLLHRRQRIRHRLARLAAAKNQRRQPGPDIAAARHRRQMVERAQQPQPRQRLDHPQAKRRAADPPARQRQPHQLRLIGAGLRALLRIVRLRPQPLDLAPQHR